MKKNLFYISIISLLLLCEIFAQIEEKQLFHAYWTCIFRALSFIMMGIWYYLEQKEDFGIIQKLFLISILLSIFIALANCFLNVQKAVFINLLISNLFILVWIIVFKLLGAAIKRNEKDDIFKKLFPYLFILPIIYYFYTLYPVIPFLYAILVFIYIVLFSYATIISTFLPIIEQKRILITVSLILFIFMSFMNSQDLFLGKMPLAYPITRGLIVISRCLMIYGMIDYNLGMKENSTDED